MSSDEYKKSRAGDGGFMEPEYVRTAEASKIFGPSRSTWYELMRDGQIAYVTFRKPGMKKATRLLSVRSLRAFMESRIEGGRPS